MAIGAVIGGAINAYQQYQSTGHIDAGQVAYAAVGGAVAGGLIVTGGYAIAAAAGAITAATTATAVAGAACADGDCTNEVSAVATAGVQAISADGDPTNEVTAITKYAPQNTAITKYYPPNMGFSGDPMETQFQEGEIIAQVGKGGRFFTLPGTPSSSISLPYGKMSLPTNYYQVVKPFTVYAGPASPWFGQPGGGTQYMCLWSQTALEDKGYIIPCQ